MRLVSWVMKLLRPAGGDSYVDQYEDRQTDTRATMVDGKAMTPSGGFIDFEADSEKPKY